MAAYQYAFRMICIILWKSWRSRKHRFWQSVVQVLAPVILVLLLVSVKGVMEQKQYDGDADRKMDKPMFFPPKNMRSLLEGLCQISCLIGEKNTALLTYAPKDKVTTDLMNRVKSIINSHGFSPDIQGFESELQIEALGALLRQNNTGYFGVKKLLIGSVIFMSNGENPKDLIYKIRLVSSKFETGKLFPDIETPGPGSQFKHYENSGFLGLQLAIDEAYLKGVKLTPRGSKTALDLKVEAKAFPHPPYGFLSMSHYTMVLAVLLPSAIIIGFGYMASVTIATLVEERTSGVQDFFTMLGLNRSGYWFGWMLNVFFIQLISVGIIVFILRSNVSGDGAVLQYSDRSVLWLFLVLYLYASIWFCFFVSSLFDTDKHTHSLGAVLWLGTFIVPAILIGSKQRYLATQLLVAVLPNMCLYWGFGVFANWESRAVGVRWNNLEEYASPSDSLNFASMLAMLVFDSIFYMTLTMFVKHWGKGKRTLKDPFHLLLDVLVDADGRFPDFPHPLQKACACLKKNKAKVKKPTKELGVDEDLETPIGVLRSKVLAHLGLLHKEGTNEFETSPMEEQSLTKESGVKLRNISKNFQAESVLKSVSIDFYIGEIACICGEGGSGKTTLLHILNGIVKSDDGTAYINKYDIHDYLTDVRSCIGICSQENILFGDLSVMEHLLMFAWLKGRDWSSSRQDALQLLAMLKMKDKGKIQADKLTPNDKRKLTFAISVMGNPKVILLDEPTAGMDHESAKNVLNILLKLKEGKTIIVTTKSLEEADVVADRVAIINDGHLRCYGSPQYLREAFGNGYTLKLRVHTKSAEKLVRMITEEIKYAEVKHRTLSVGGEELVFVLPDLYSPHFPKLFDQLYSRKDALGILSVDIHRTSVEEIYYRVHELREFTEQPSATDDSHSRKAAQPSFFVGKKLIGLQLGMARFVALMKKNYWMTRSNMWAIGFQILVPLALIICGLTGANRGLRNRDTDHYTQLSHSLSNYENAHALYSIADPAFRRGYSSVVDKAGENTKDDSRVSKTILEVAEKDIAAYRHEYVVGVEQLKNMTLATARYSTLAFNAPALSMNLVSNARLRMLTPMAKKQQKIIVENHPLENGTDDVLSSIHEAGTNVLAKSFCFYFAFALGIISASVALKPMMERVCGSHHLQAMTGVNPVLFWLAYGLVDTLFLLLFVCLSVFIAFVLQERYIFTMYGGAEMLFLILLLGGIASSKFAYFFSQLVDNPFAAFGWLNMLHLLAVLGSFIVYQANDGVLDLFSEVFYWASSPFPVVFAVHSFYLFSRLIMDNGQCELTSENTLNMICSKADPLYRNLPAFSCCAANITTGSNVSCSNGTCFVPKSFYTTSYGIEGYNLTRDLIVLSVSAVAYYLLVVFMDFNLFRRLNQYFLAAPSDAFENAKIDKDPSAAMEAERVTKLIGLGAEAPEEEGLLVDGLCKNYGTTGAYCNVSFAIKHGECFGLLGLSGAGKSSVFRTLVGQDYPAVGDAYLNPYSLIRSCRQFTTRIGYCPQKNAILTDLTGREMLLLHGGLKGICSKDLHTEVNQWLSALGLENDADRQCGEYSKGMRRRLSVAMALIGDPEVLILDDPSREIDSTGRKNLWSILHRLRRDNKIILLATSNVVECETLCGRLGLMINGRLQYVGSTTEIKSKFLNGFTVTFRLKKRFAIDDEGDVELVGDIKTAIESILEDGVFRDAHQNTLKYLIPHQDQNWGSIVERLEKVRTTLTDSVDYYSMMESSLDEVFAAMSELDAESTNELEGAHVTCWQRCLMGQCCTDDYS